MLSNDYARIERAIQILKEEYPRQPRLEEIAGKLRLSPFHFQRLFRRWAGISPKRFVQFLTVQHAKSLLEESRDVLSASFDSGLSSPGRLHDLFVSMEAMTPGEFKSGGKGLLIDYGFHATPFGECLIAATDRGICSLAFVPSGKRLEVLSRLRNTWKGAVLRPNLRRTGKFADQVFSRSHNRKGNIPLHLRGSNFQIKVWQALLTIPSSRILSYEDVAEKIGKPKAARAVGSAVANNPIAFIIPCHRVVQKSGILGNYRWGAKRKAAILAWESAGVNSGS